MFKKFLFVFLVSYTLLSIVYSPKTWKSVCIISPPFPLSNSKVVLFYNIKIHN